MTDEMPEDPFNEAQEPEDTDDDPFAYVKVPAVSFKGAPIGTEVRFEVTEAARMVQQRDFATKELKVWKDGNPRMAAVFRGRVNGETRTLWVPKPGSLFTAMGEAQHDTGGRRIGPGDVIYVKLVDEKPSGKGNDQKIYTVRLER